MSTDQDSGAALRSQYGGIGGVQRTFTAKVNDYLQSRPDYPAALFKQLRVLCGLAPGSTIADVGAGTGLLTRDLLACGWYAVAVEPNDEMRAAADALLGSWANYRSLNGSAEKTGLADQSVDLITAAQAFHWFDVDATARECARVLRPGAMVALIWNDRVPDDPLNIALDKVLDEFGGSKRKALLAHEQAREVTPFFGGAPAYRLRFPHQHQLSLAGLKSLVFSRSYMPQRESSAGATVRLAIESIVAAIDDPHGVSMRYQTTLILGTYR